MKFTVKVLVGFGWRLFGEKLLTSLDVDSLRAYIGVDGYKALPQNRIRFNDPFLIGTDPEHNEIYRKFEKAIVRDKLSTVYIRQQNEFVEWTVTCVGYIVATIIVPVRTSTPLIDIPAEKGLLLTLGRHGMSQELIEALL